MEINALHIGIAAGIFTAVAMLPQLMKLIRQKKAEQISIKMVLIMLIGLILWVWYGIEKKDYPVIITNAFSCLLNILVIFFSLKYKNKAG